MDEVDEKALGSTLRPCARGCSLPPSIPKQQRRSDKQRNEEPGHAQDLCQSAPLGAQPEGHRDRGDQRLSECHREQRARHPRWPEARDDGAGDPYGEHPEVHQVGGVVLGPDDPNGKVYPDQKERCRKRNADGVDAVTDTNLPIAEGEFMILVGPSGSGKSTALRMVAALEDTAW